MTEIQQKQPKKRRFNFRHFFWTPGEPWRSVRFWVVPRLLKATHSLLMCSLRVSISGLKRTYPYLDMPSERGAILVTWHDLTLCPLNSLRNKNLAVMMSRSRAGQMQAAFWRLYGWPTVWGSSTRKREAVQALRAGINLLRSGRSFAFSPDGPKGPRREAQPGVVFMASHAPSVIFPCGVAASAAWRMKTWDRYLIPKPFARVHIHMGEPIHLPENLPRDQIEEWRLVVQEAMDQAEVIAYEKLGMSVPK